MCKVSVVIPIYNAEKYIEEGLESLFDQTLKDIEIICVNDGSTDRTREILERYAKDDGRIIVVNKENGGPSAARNAGIQAASGEYIYFMDSDDYILEHTLEALYREVKEHNLDTIYFDADSFYENDELEGKHKSYKEYYHRSVEYSDVVSGRQLLSNMVANNEFRPSPCLQMNRRSFLEANNIGFYPGIIHEDNLFSLLVSLYSKRAKHVSKAFYMRRVRGGSIMTMTASDPVNSCEGYFVCMKEILPLIMQEVTEPEILDAYMQRVRTLRNHAVKCAKQFSKEDKDRMLARIRGDEALFHVLVMDYAEMALTKERKIKSQKQEIKVLKEENEKILESNSYKIGRKVTFLPRKIKMLKKKDN